AQHYQLRALTDAFLVEETVQHVDAFHRLAFEAYDEIAFAQAGLCCRAVWLDRKHQGAAHDLEVVVVGNGAVQARRLRLYSNVAATHNAFANQFAGDELGRSHRDRKAEPLRGQDSRRVDPDHLACGIHQRTTGVSGIEGSVGLDHVFDQAT